MFFLFIITSPLFSPLPARQIPCYKQALCHANYPSLTILLYCVNMKILKICGFITFFYFYHSTQYCYRLSIFRT